MRCRAYKLLALWTEWIEQISIPGEGKMEPTRIVRAAGIASVAWVGINAVSLVQNSSGPAPEPASLLLRLVAGPLVFLLAGNAVAWLINRARTVVRDAPDGHRPLHPALEHCASHGRRT